MSVRERTTEFYEAVRSLVDGDPWFEKRGLDSIRRREVDDETLTRRRRYQRYLGTGFVALLGLAV
jgi:hypothetical protein